MKVKRWLNECNNWCNIWYNSIKCCTLLPPMLPGVAWPCNMLQHCCNKMNMFILLHRCCNEKSSCRVVAFVCHTHTTLCATFCFFEHQIEHQIAKSNVKLTQHNVLSCWCPYSKIFFWFTQRMLFMMLRESLRPMSNECNMFSNVASNVALNVALVWPALKWKKNVI